MWHNQGLSGKPNFGAKYVRSVQQGRREAQVREEGEVGPEDEPGKWLVDTDASNYYSPFKHLFVHLMLVWLAHLMQCIPPVEILTGNRWVFVNHYGTIPLIIRVEGEVVRKMSSSPWMVRF
ncbi:hypothetical protein L211DRAFT_257805 [Terfezia boudieri ATCC MYA-4762]|uniref:Uncharacterized protein n=1 Tax=Terfezia boudieri ATCC MYA-4762 TaxID=1051890 RepID=A0A3N4MLZ1_9PEZI|nr:hypothetical protein L211DRAFT_257805 [Terfezia boudieri ATCC MYA-4762]